MLEVPKSKKKNHHAIRDGCPQPFYVLRLADRTPTGGKSQNTGVLGHFGLGRPLALREIPGGKQKNTNSHIETEKRETNPLQLGPNTQS